MIRVTVWGENVHEETNEVVRGVYPDGMHNVIAGGLAPDSEIETRTATLEQDDEHGLSEEVLDQTDVLTWWGRTTKMLICHSVLYVCLMSRGGLDTDRVRLRERLGAVFLELG